MAFVNWEQNYFVVGGIHAGSNFFLGRLHVSGPLDSEI